MEGLVEEEEVEGPVDDDELWGPVDTPPVPPVLLCDVDGWVGSTEYITGTNNCLVVFTRLLDKRRKS